ncbi:unnamed protein product [Ostreobium quekettii]|uniref:Peptidase S1 domain-containing protein n=1 Tax=Ostreobium quekettii TaxID=121088 RepID=A0A8S1JCG8_9CHLO|nr:unnamed protein product [Ostreobium quekettii]
MSSVVAAAVFLLAACLAQQSVIAAASSWQLRAGLTEATLSNLDAQYRGKKEFRSQMKRALRQEDAEQPQEEGESSLCARFPYAVSFRDHNDVHRCDGVLINHNWALTAARCVDPDIPYSAGGTPIVVIGSCTLDHAASSHGEIEETLAKEVVIHEKWKGDVADKYDIALVKLSHKSTHQPVGLPTSRDALDMGLNFTALGWHEREDGVVGRELRGAIPIHLVDSKQCKHDELEDLRIGKTLVCAVGGNDEDLCEAEKAKRYVTMRKG